MQQHVADQGSARALLRTHPQGLSDSNQIQGIIYRSGVPNDTPSDYDVADIRRW